MSKNSNKSDNCHIVGVSTSLDDPDRRECEWTDTIDSTILRWGEDCQQKSHEHKSYAKINNVLHFAFALPAITLPLIAVWLDNWLTPSTTISANCLVAITSLLVAISSLCAFQKKQMLHEEHQARYHNLNTLIEKELCKHKRDRQACDVFIEKVMIKYNTLNKSSSV